MGNECTHSSHFDYCIESITLFNGELYTFTYNFDGELLSLINY
jgi:hypothetical protein